MAADNTCKVKIGFKVEHKPCESPNCIVIDQDTITWNCDLLSAIFLHVKTP